VSLNTNFNSLFLVGLVVVLKGLVLVLLCGTVYQLTCVHWTFLKETKNAPFQNCLLDAHLRSQWICAV